MPIEYGSPSGDPNLGGESTRDLQALSDHITHWWGEPFVYHEIISEYVHIDLHVVAPTDDRPFHKVITTGMSDRRMNAPEGAEECGYCELLLGLPPDWPVSEEQLKNEKNWWPLRHLKQTARFPHIHETWLWYSHTVGNGGALEPLVAGSPFVGFAVSTPLHCEEGARKLHIRDGKDVYFFSLIPLYERELKFAWEQGTEALFKHLDEANVTEVLDPKRPCVVGPTRRNLRDRLRSLWPRR